jgi:predicted alpha/beta-fold hydrolase
LNPGNYAAPWWLPGPHSQTVLPARLLPAPHVAWRRERWDTPDGDFLDVDHAVPDPMEDSTRDMRAGPPGPGGPAPAPGQDAPRVVLFHGLEGSSASHYSRALLHACLARGWRGLVVHFRGCGGEENRLARAYHSGDSGEIEWVLARVAARWPASPRFAVGISLGGNALAKWAGERGRAATSVQACAVVSSPVDLLAGGLALERPGNRAYTVMFLATLRGKALAKVRRFPGIADASRIARARTLREFDDAFTAPVHGFRGVIDYWTRSSALPHLRGVGIPMLLLNARNDPFLPASHLPGPAQVSRYVELEQPEQGGHAGFYQGGPEPWYLARRVPDFFSRLLPSAALRAGEGWGKRVPAQGQ